MNLMAQKVGTFMGQHPDEAEQLGRAAISAMKEPTEHMIRAGVCALNDSHPRSLNYDYRDNCATVEAVFKAMIEEASK